MKMLHHSATETVVQNVIFDRRHDFHAAREKFERARVHRFDPTRVDQRDRDSFFFKFLGCFLSNFEHVAETEDSDIATVLHDFGFADLEKPRLGFKLSSSARTARITNGDWT